MSAPVLPTILDLDSPPLEIIASDQKRLVVDAFARYRIKDALRFYQTLGSIPGDRCPQVPEDLWPGQRRRYSRPGDRCSDRLTRGQSARSC